MDFSAVQKRPRIRNMIAMTASSANGVLIHDAASALIRADMNESPTINPNHQILIGGGFIFSAIV
jgi:hypothetical protein